MESFGIGTKGHLSLDWYCILNLWDYFGGKSGLKIFYLENFFGVCANVGTQMSFYQ
ncbi:unnamed protein product [Meloidogyne enterolobii]|uniref:Uncharacterized protein n=1 Tax=Meloidogyne enterolobii TaxID=390850 RepID=A0ACB1AJC9_MELEN